MQASIPMGSTAPPAATDTAGPNAGAPVTITPLDKLPAQQRFWRWFHALGYGVLGVAAGIALLMLLDQGLEGFDGWGIGLAATAVLAALLAGLGWWYGGLYFAHYQGSLYAGEGVVLHSGVWWRSEAWVPMARLQHLDVTQGPLDRRWGMATLTLNTAGTHDHRLRIKGLPVAQAHALRAALLPRARSAHE
jgi:membrane protein YdbS with pleckstrin-like domain